MMNNLKDKLYDQVYKQIADPVDAEVYGQIAWSVNGKFYNLIDRQILDNIKDKLNGKS